MTTQPEETSVLEKNIRFFVTLYSFFKNIIKLFLLEFVLAKESAKRIFIYTAIVILLGLSLWLMLLVISTVALHDWLGGWLLPLGIVAATNFFIVMIMLLRIFSHAKNMGFRHTKMYLGKQHRGEHYAHSSFKNSDQKS